MKGLEGNGTWKLATQQIQPSKIKTDESTMFLNFEQMEQMMNKVMNWVVAPMKLIYQSA